MPFMETDLYYCFTIYSSMVFYLRLATFLFSPECTHFLIWSYPGPTLVLPRFSAQILAGPTLVLHWSYPGPTLVLCT